MKTSVASIGCLVGQALAFPQAITPSMQSELQNLGQQAANAVGAQQNRAPSFNAGLQKIDVSGSHEFRPPGPNDARGPCPGLNALANHGYLPRSGYATILQFVAATTTVFGMGPVLAVVLSAYGAVINGNVLGWSIAGGSHTGIGGSRGNYETDNSPTRGDLHQYGSNSDLVLSQFKTLYDLQPDDAATSNYNIDVLSEFRNIRWEESIAKNPWFYYGPFSGTTVSIAAYSFIYRFMANHTAENPEGVLNTDVLKSFFSVTGNSDNLQWVRGHERIPENWYRRAIDSPYDLDGVGSDGGVFIERTPATGTPGCNTGEVNSFVEIKGSYQDFDFSSPTAGVCFAVGAILGITDILPVVNVLVNQLILPIQNVLDCSTVPARNDSVGDVCPGYSFYAGPTGPVAPGAIQN